MKKRKGTGKIFCGIILLSMVLFTGCSVGFAAEPIKEPYKEVKTYIIEADEIQNIDLSWMAGEVTIIPWNDSKIKMIESSKRKLEKKEYLSFDTKGKNLSIHFFENKNEFIIPVKKIPMKKLELFLPKELVNRLNMVKLDTSSTDEKIKNIDVNKLIVNTVASDYTLEGITADDLSFDRSSGNVRMLKVNAPLLSVKTVSGDSTLEEITADNTSFDSSSGDINMSRVNSTHLSVTTVLGNVELTDGKCNNIVLDTSSGVVDINSSKDISK